MEQGLVNQKIWDIAIFFKNETLAAFLMLYVFEKNISLLMTGKK
jgi:hypothetical protein